MNIIELQDVSFAYGPKPVFSRLNFALPAGSFLAVAGPNGTGKSTLIKLLCRRIKPQQGNILIDSQPLASYSNRLLAQKVSVVSQETAPVFGFSVAQTVLMARTIHFGQFGFEDQKDRDIVLYALEVTDTLSLADRPLESISVGEKQRVFIARCLAQETPLLLLDEPTSFLDIRHRVKIFDLLKQMQLEQGKTIITVTHDLNLAAQYCRQVLLLCDDGSSELGPPQKVLSAENIRKIFHIDGIDSIVKGVQFFVPFGEFSNINPSQSH